MDHRRLSFYSAAEPAFFLHLDIVSKDRFLLPLVPRRSVPIFGFFLMAFPYPDYLAFSLSFFSSPLFFYPPCALILEVRPFLLPVSLIISFYPD